MKNMKKLLGAMAALGFTTVAAVNVVACGNPSNVQDNDLTKTYAKSATATLETSDDLAHIGLTLKEADKGTYTFKFSDITDAAINNVIKPSSAIKNPLITKGITTNQDMSKVTAPTTDKDEIAQLVPNTKDGDITAAGDLKTVTYVITLKLYKATKDEKASSKFVWADQKTSMDITVNINTEKSAKDFINLRSITGPTKINASLEDLTKVTASEIEAQRDIGDAIDKAVKDQFPDAGGEYTIAWASDNSGKALGSLDLTSTKDIYVKLTANPDAKAIDPNTKTDWLKVTLPAVNSLTQITAKSFGEIKKGDFPTTGVTAAEVTRANIVDAIKKNASLDTALKAINSKFSDLDKPEQIKIVIAKTAKGGDMAPTDNINLDGQGANVYVTITAGTTPLFSETTGEITVALPDLAA